MLRRVSIQAFLDGLTHKLRGEWVLVGGALVALVADPDRGTEDIDLIPLEMSNQARSDLLDAAREAGLGVEAVNSAADYFLKRIDGWREMLTPAIEAPDLTIYYPTVGLFVRMKIERMSETDLSDCLAMMPLAADDEDWEPVLLRLTQLVQEQPEAPALERRRHLLGLVLQRAGTGTIAGS